MLADSGKSVFSNLLVWTAALTTILVLPDMAYDPINVPKLAVITVSGFIALGGLVAERRILIQSKFRLVHIFGVAFILQLTLVLLIAGTNFNQEFFGTFGRATGFVAYFSLTLLLIAAAIASQPSTLKKFTWALLATGAVSTFYGAIQAAGVDPINWTSKYNPVIGFLGNPNFQSSFLGLNGIIVFSLMVGRKKRAFRLLMAFDLIVSAAVISATDSQQGLLILAGGISVVTLIWIRTSRFKVVYIPIFIASFIGATFVALGSLNSGPLATLLYKSSVTYRGDYWRAAWKITIEHPIFGVGLDSYGDWYRRARTVEATSRRGPDAISNAAHNVLLDLSSNGGFPLLIIYLFMVGLVLISAWKVLHRTNYFEPIFAGLFAVWIGYQAQSIISLNQLGLAVWGWIISGLIIGYEINTREDAISGILDHEIRSRENVSRFTQKRVKFESLVAMTIGGLIGLVVGLPPLLASNNFVSALKSRNSIVLQKAAYVSPSDPNYMSMAVEILVQNKLYLEATVISNDAITRFKDHYPTWLLRSKMPGLSQAEVEHALREMKRLDPNNPNLK